MRLLLKGAARMLIHALTLANSGGRASRRSGVRTRRAAAMETLLTRTALELLAASSTAGNRDAAAALAASVEAKDRRSARAFRRPATSATPEHRGAMTALAAAIEAGDGAVVRAITRTVQLEPDLRAEKVVSHHHRFLWICNPKVASRSIINALRSADPDAELIVGRTMDEIFAARPEIRGYHHFAFIRDPLHRTFSCYADKFVRLAGAGQPEAIRYFVEPYHGVRPDMSFAEFCRWLNTPYGSDLFADRHWLSQHRQIRLPDGSLPDFIGRYECLDTDWKTVTARLGLPSRPLPRLNANPGAMVAEEHLDGETVALLRRRYAEDFRLGGYDI